MPRKFWQLFESVGISLHVFPTACKRMDLFVLTAFEELYEPSNEAQVTFVQIVSKGSLQNE